MGEKGGRLSRNMYKGRMDNAKGGRIVGGRWGRLGLEGSGGGKMEATVLEQ